jgi:putative endonuclease
MWPFRAKHKPEGTAAVGLAGEKSAEQFLRSAGMTILARRYRVRGGEIDLVADEHGTIVFIEVKTLSSRAWNEPQDRVTPVKQQRLARAAAHYVKKQKLELRPLRFDIVAVALDRDPPLLAHFRDAFTPPH